MKLSAEIEARLAAMRFPCGPNTVRTLIADALDEERRELIDGLRVSARILNATRSLTNNAGADAMTAVADELEARIGRERAETKEGE